MPTEKILKSKSLTMPVMINCLSVFFHLCDRVTAQLFNFVSESRVDLTSSVRGACMFLQYVIIRRAQSLLLSEKFV